MVDNTRLYHGVLMGAGLLALSLAGFGAVNSRSPEDPGLVQLRKAVAPFHNLPAAQKAGYTTVVAHPTTGATCLADQQMGGMGVHYLNAALVDDTVISAKPEILIYEPQKDGSLKFVGVEYIVPFKIRAATATPPVLFGKQFTKNDTFQLWGLHAWVGRSNPSGTFADYNPDVSCTLAAS
jgi:hypothetical protein